MRRVLMKTALLSALTAAFLTLTAAASALGTAVVTADSCLLYTSVGYPVLLFYMLMVGGTPSVVRACVMTGLFLLGPLLGREGDAPTSLAAAARCV